MTCPRPEGCDLCGQHTDQQLGEGCGQVHAAGGHPGGKNENKFDPKGTATRAEVATVLRQFVEIVIDPQAANGWQQNDSGQWSYYRNGKPVKGWLSDDRSGTGWSRLPDDVCRRLEAD